MARTVQARPDHHSTDIAPAQSYPENLKKTPVAHIKTRRIDKVSVVTTSQPGRMVPLKAIPLLREDGLLNSRVTLNVQMAETAQMLLNPVRVSTAAYFVPKLAFERFLDMGTIDRSYNKQPEIDDTVVPWFRPDTDPASPVLQTLGVHVPPGDDFNDDYKASYNQIWNYIAQQRSSSIPLRTETDGTLAPAFWRHSQMKHVKPTFDDAMLAGEVPLSITDQRIPVTGMGTNAGLQYEPASRFTTGGNTVEGQWSQVGADKTPPSIMEDPDNPGFPGVFAELQSNGITVSLANLDLARETAAWARLRSQYQGMSEDWMIDQLLQGIRIRDENLRYPILLDSRDSVIGMAQRYATDFANLEKSVTDGQSTVSLNLRVPATPCGGIVMIVAQVLPEMIFERQRDYYLSLLDTDHLPNRTADELDPQPIETLKNVDIETTHSLPDDLFGYAPLNSRWQRMAPNVGGLYRKDTPDEPWTEQRGRIWDTSVVDPTLTSDFYIANDIPTDVFADTQTDQFEWWLSGDCQIEGLTYFGPSLRENPNDDYDTVLGKVDLERLAGDGSDIPDAP